MTDVLVDENLRGVVRDLRRDGRSPKEIARALGLRPSVVSGVVRTIARERDAGDPSSGGEATGATPLAGCWVNRDWENQLAVDGHPEWPRSDGVPRGCDGLATVVVARQLPDRSVSVCTFLVDIQCLGVKSVIGPRIMRRSALRRFLDDAYGAYPQPPVAAPIDLARHLVYGAVGFARSLGFEPPPDFPQCTGHLGDWEGSSAIRFGRHGKPMYVAGPYDNVAEVLRTLDRSVGKGGYDYLIGLPADGGHWAAAGATAAARAR